jgi:peptidylprolyl isomerase
MHGSVKLCGRQKRDSPQSLILAKGKLVLMQSRKLPAMILLVGLLVMAAGCTGASQEASSMAPPSTTSQGKLVKLETTMGNITIELRPDMPVTAGNFEKLVGKGFYDNTIFHRVIDGFMIQGGDPTGTGRGGPGYVIRDEFTANNRNVRGTIAMANAGPNTGGSQFFINLVDNSHLNAKHPVFGKVVEGMDVVDRIGKVKTDSNDRPVTPVKITKAMVVNS